MAKQELSNGYKINLSLCWQLLESPLITNVECRWRFRMDMAPVELPH